MKTDADLLLERWIRNHEERVTSESRFVIAEATRVYLEGLSSPNSVYVAGPMTGIPEFNYPAFHAAAKVLRAIGLDVICPPEENARLGPDHVPGSLKPAEYVRNDLQGLLRCSGIALLPGWENSVGARCEAAIAISLGFTFFDHETGDVCRRPESIEIRKGYSP